MAKPVRLNKLLAERGIAARRKCDRMIEEGKVRLDGEVHREPGIRVDPDLVKITVSGKPLPSATKHIYIALNKPKGYLTTLSDPSGRPTVQRFLPTKGPRLYPIGRLDGDTSGLLLFTNDGSLAHRVMHPRYEIPKTYVMTLTEEPTAAALARIEQGVVYAPGEKSQPAQARIVKSMGEVTEVALTLCEGRNRQVRKMAEALGWNLLALRREEIGPVKLGTLASGKTRALLPKEVSALRRAIEIENLFKDKNKNKDKDGDRDKNRGGAGESS